MYWIDRNPKRALAVGRLLPWVHLRHGDLLRGKLNRPYRIFCTLSSLRTGFSPQLTGCSWRLVHLICVRSSPRQITICAGAPSTRDILLTYAAKPHCSSPSKQNSWDSLSGCLARVYTLEKEGPMPSKRLAAHHIGLGPARAASLGVRACVAAIAIVAASISSAGAQDWPTRPIRLVVGAAAGGGTDISARLIAQPLSEILGQAVVVENRAGAAGTTAAEAVAKSAKDGYTAYMMSNAHAISAAMYKSLRYDPINCFRVVPMAACGVFFFAPAPAFPASDLAGALAAVRANPGKFNFGSAGVGTTQHFAGELMKQTAGLDITHVPYRSTPAAVTGL